MKTGGWKWEEFVHWFPQDIIRTIASHKLIRGEEYEDQVRWAPSTSTGFSIALALSLIQ